MIVACLFASCHDASRENPFDSALTPPVEDVRAQISDSTGVALIEWAPYEGQTDFHMYLVMRREKTLVEIDTLAHLGEQAQTAYADTSIRPDRDYIYWIEVVNTAGFGVPSEPLSVQSFTVTGVELTSIADSPATGHIVLTWDPYIGPGFDGYEIWRRAFGEDTARLDSIPEVETSAWTDTTARPGADYFYWVNTIVFGAGFESARAEISYEIPAVRIESLLLSSETATAELAWSQYDGPRFQAYEVHRRVEGGLNVPVELLETQTITSYTDTVLDGNTEYLYRVVVHTEWEGGISSASPERSGIFYPLVETRELQSISNSEAQAIGAALDGMDDIYIAMSAISTTTARAMQAGVQVMFPGGDGYRPYFSRLEGNSLIPHRLSPVRLAVDTGGRVYTAVSDTVSKSVVLGAIDTDRRELWFRLIDTDGAFPAGLYEDEDGSIVMIDYEGFMYRSDSEGNVEGPLDLIRKTLIADQGIPVQHVVRAPEAGAGSGNDQFFFSVPDRERNHIIAKTKVTDTIYGGNDSTFDDGVGPDSGETLDPLVIAFDASSTRLMVMEARGLLQVFDARSQDTERRFVTKWGRFGDAPGEFQVSPPTAIDMVVDSQGRIHVVDGGSEGGRFQVFAP